jgi:hypothetical protein
VGHVWGQVWPGTQQVGESCGKQTGMSHRGWCARGLYCAEDMGILHGARNECKECPCNGHGTCGRGTNPADGGAGDNGGNGGIPGPCACDPGFMGTDCLSRCSGSGCDNGRWGAGLAQLNELLGDLSIRIPFPCKDASGQPSGEPGACGTIGWHALKLDWAISNIVCGNIGIGGLKLRASKPTDVEMQVQITDVTVQCTADWKFKELVSASGHAIATATAGDHNSVHTTVKYHSDDYRTQLPSLSSNGADSCAAQVRFGKLELKGSDLGGHMLSLFEDHIGREIQEQLQGKTGETGELCQQLGKMVSDTLTALLGKVNHAMEPLLPYLNFTTPPQDALSKELKLKSDCSSVSRECPPPQLVDFRTDWLLGLLQTGAKKLNSKAPAVCRADWKGEQRCSGPLVINDVVNFITSQLGGEGQIDVLSFFNMFGINSTVSTGNSAVASATLEVQALKLDGLNSL